MLTPVLLVRNPHRLVTLMELLRFHAHLFCWASGALSQSFEQIRCGRLLTPDSLGSVATALRDLERESANLGLISVSRQVARIKEYADRPSFNQDDLSRLLMELHARILDELEGQHFLYLPLSQRHRYEAPLQEWDKVTARFHSASFDVEEASKCFALARYTACVYHLMRVTELGLSVIAKRVGFRDERPMWGPVLTYIDKQLGTKYEEMSQLFKGDLEFLGGVAAQMRAVNLAWRRRVMHIERVYSEEEARRIWDATKALMEHLAERLSESPEPLA